MRCPAGIAAWNGLFGEGELNLCVRAEHIFTCLADLLGSRSLLPAPKCPPRAVCAVCTEGNARAADSPFNPLPPLGLRPGARRSAPNASRLTASIPEAAPFQRLRVAGGLDVISRPAGPRRSGIAHSLRSPSCPLLVTRSSAVPYCIPAAPVHRAGRFSRHQHTVSQHPLDLPVTANGRWFRPRAASGSPSLESAEPRGEALAGSRSDEE